VVRTSTDRERRRRQAPPLRRGTLSRRHWTKRAAVIFAVGTLAVIVLAFVMPGTKTNKEGMHPRQPGPAALPATPGSYLGVYADGVPMSYAGVTAFTTATGVRPRLVVYYSGWLEPFRTSFATTAAKHGAVPLVQIDPTDISLSAIASGQYDAYLTSYAQAVRAYHDPVILSFGHEMNGTWFSWGYRYTSPAVFVAAWRHIVTLFRELGTRNVTWLWTVNIIKTLHGRIPSPAPWWPGSSYVTWVGIDGYFLKPSWQFVPIFGPTIVAVRELTGDPILIAETSATPAASQPAKIADLFAGIHTYGLLGFVWFDNNASHDYRINSPAAIAALRHDAKIYRSPTSLGLYVSWPMLVRGLCRFRGADGGVVSVRDGRPCDGPGKAV
jgi:mannan endo-1,4-beta-mannosidase